MSTDLRAAMAEAGVDPGAEPLIQDGQIHRYRGPGDKAGKKNCWYVLYPSGFAVFGSWRLGIEEKWRNDGGSDKSFRSDGDRIKIEEARGKADSEREQAHATAAAKALTLWKKCTAPDPAHPYLIAKRIQAQGVRQLGRALVVPVRSIETGQIVNLQLIQPDGSKTF